MRRSKCKVGHAMNMLTLLTFLGAEALVMLLVLLIVVDLVVAQQQQQRQPAPESAAAAAADPHVMFYFNPGNALGARQLRELQRNIERSRARVQQLQATVPTSDAEREARQNEMSGAAIYAVMQQLSEESGEHTYCMNAHNSIDDPCVTVDYDSDKRMCRVTYRCKIDDIAPGQKSVSAITEPEARRKFKTAVL